jgi:flavodoxin I
MKAVGLFYGSSSGKTEKIACKIKDRLSRFTSVELFDIAEVNTVDLRKYSLLIFGVSTWGIGRLQDDWLRFIVNNPPSNLNGNCLAFFGLGDQGGYPDTFNDGMGLLYEIYRPSGFTLIGKWPVTGYSFEDSKALEGKEFVGLALDEDNQAEKTDERIDSWVSQIIRESKNIIQIRI